MKFFSLLALARDVRTATVEPNLWLRDPLSHPALDVMSERELGDMPFRLTARRTEREMTLPPCR